jgi:hypothetical protein
MLIRHSRTASRCFIKWPGLASRHFPKTVRRDHADFNRSVSALRQSLDNCEPDLRALSLRASNEVEIPRDFAAVRHWVVVNENILKVVERNLRHALLLVGTGSCKACRCEHAETHGGRRCFP